MNLSSFIPQTIYGWIGVAILAFAIFMHRALTWFGLILALALFGVFYFYLDSVNATAT